MPAFTMAKPSPLVHRQAIAGLKSLLRRLFSPSCFVSSCSVQQFPARPRLPMLLVWPLVHA